MSGKLCFQNADYMGTYVLQVYYYSCCPLDFEMFPRRKSSRESSSVEIVKSIDSEEGVGGVDHNFPSKRQNLTNWKEKEGFDPL